MADCVVPQEYGTTIPEKRSVGVKICHGLLEKIKYDLNIARKDNEVDMRYLINLAYQSDLNINSLGRRVRTRLYFTSESHLHTVLSVLRFCSSEDQRSVLSKEGISIINSTPELCYLTQIIMRVFEDARRPMDDPKRFRVEILFSPGATATPFHMHEKERDKDTSRFDTAPLQKIGRPDLTCKDVEDFLEKVMLAGGQNHKSDDNTVDASSMGEQTEQSKMIDSRKMKTHEDIPETRPESTGAPSEEAEQPISFEFQPTEVGRHSRTASGLTETDADDAVGSDAKTDDADTSSKKDEDDTESDLPTKNRGLDTVRHKYFWGTVAVGSFTLGVYCLLMALNMSRDSRGRKRWSRRY